MSQIMNTQRLFNVLLGILLELNSVIKSVNGGVGWGGLDTVHRVLNMD